MENRFQEGYLCEIMKHTVDGFRNPIPKHLDMLASRRLLFCRIRDVDRFFFSDMDRQGPPTVWSTQQPS